MFCLLGTVYCTQEAGDILVVPAHWGHATLNLEVGGAIVELAFVQLAFVHLAFAHLVFVRLDIMLWFAFVHWCIYLHCAVSHTHTLLKNIYMFVLVRCVATTGLCRCGVRVGECIRAEERAPRRRVPQATPEGVQRLAHPFGLPSVAAEIAGQSLDQLDKFELTY